MTDQRKYGNRPDSVVPPIDRAADLVVTAAAGAFVGGLVTAGAVHCLGRAGVLAARYDTNVPSQIGALVGGVFGVWHSSRVAGRPIPSWLTRNVSETQRGSACVTRSHL